SGCPEAGFTSGTGQMDDIKFYFLVTGRTKNNGFSGFADRLVIEIVLKLISGSVPGTARFVHFDFWNNKVEVDDYTPTKSSARRGPRWIPLAKFTPSVGDKSQDPQTFVDIAPHTITIFENEKLKTVT